MLDHPRSSVRLDYTIVGFLLGRAGSVDRGFFGANSIRMRKKLAGNHQSAFVYMRACPGFCRFEYRT